MKIPERLQVTAWLATLIVSVAFLSHVFGQPQDITAVVILVSCCLLAVDWLLAPRQGRK